MYIYFFRLVIDIIFIIFKKLNNFELNDIMFNFEHYANTNMLLVNIILKLII